MAPDARVINLETAVTRSAGFAPDKAICCRMSPGNLPAVTAAHPDACALTNNHVLAFGHAGLTDTLRARAKFQPSVGVATATWDLSAGVCAGGIKAPTTVCGKRHDGNPGGVPGRGRRGYGCALTACLDTSVQPYETAAGHGTAAAA